jgi:hypothetical protein
MKRLIPIVLLLAGCSESRSSERYGFVATLGRDTISIESVSRRGNTIVSEEVDRFPKVRRRHTEIELGAEGGVSRLVMDIHTPDEPENQRDRRVEAIVTRDTVRLTKRDGTGTKHYTFATGGVTAMPHLPQMYSLYELYFSAALRKSPPGPGERIRLRQFYIDREFDRFPLHQGFVWTSDDGKAHIRHDWLSGIGEATLDSSYRLISYSGEGTTYKVRVERTSGDHDVKAVAARFAEAERAKGGPKSLSVRDTVRANIGNAAFAVDYSRPLARGRQLVGGIIPFGQVWRTGANAATQFTTSARITLAGLPVPAGKYTLWTIPRPDGVQLVINRQTGQWGTGYNPAHDLGRVALQVSAVTAPVEQFTISISPNGSGSGALAMEWGTFRWSAPIEVR